jgi:hypothetical protein
MQEESFDEKSDGNMTKNESTRSENQEQKP